MTDCTRSSKELADREVDLAIRRVNDRMPRSVTPETRMEIHPSEWLTLVHAIADLRAAEFSPKGDNHHNAMACPYCNPNRATDEPPVIHDRPLSASQRLHNICDALSDHLDESPFTREEWDAVDKETVRLQNRVKELEAEVSTLRDHLAEQNRLLSLNCREVERLRAAQPPKACTHPWEHVGINADGIYWCTECFAQLRVPSITDEDQRRVLPPLTKTELPFLEEIAPISKEAWNQLTVHDSDAYTLRVHSDWCATNGTESASTKGACNCGVVETSAVQCTAFIHGGGLLCVNCGRTQSDHR